MKLTKPILVSGASGLLGSKVCSNLKKEARRVVEIGRAPELRVHGDLERIHYDFENSTNVSLPDLPIDTIIHLAQSREYSSFPEQTESVVGVNIWSTAKLLDFAVRSRARSFLLASSGAVYCPSDLPLNESSPLQLDPPNSFYSASKISAEMLAASYSEIFKVTILRYFFIYGPGQNEGKIIPRLIRKVIEGEEIEINCDGGPTIAPIFVDDAARLTLRAVREGISGSANVAGAESFTIQEVANLIGKKVGAEPVFKKVEGKPKASFIPDISKMISEIGNAQVSLEEGIESVLESTS